MPRPMGHIRVLLSARVIFDLEEADRVFAQRGQAAYNDYMRARGDYQYDYDETVLGRRLAPGPMWNFVAAALKLNEAAPDTVEIGILCKDPAEAALPIFRNLDVSGLLFQYRMLTAGKPLSAADLDAFGADLFLSRNAADVQLAIDHDVAAAVVNFPADARYARPDGGPLRIWVDGDGVAFGTEAELDFRENGLESFFRGEFNRVSSSLGAGPFTRLLGKISWLNARFPKGTEPFELSLLTARGQEASARAISTTEDLGIAFNGRMYFVNGANKGDVLRAHMPDIFFDDQQSHLQEAASFCPTGHVAYKTGTPLFNYLQRRAAAPKPG